MRSLAGTAIGDDVLRVKWLDLLPPSVSRLLKVLKASDLDEQATLADELIVSGPTVAAVNPAVAAASHRPTQSTRSPASDSMAQELAALRLTVTQLATFTRQGFDSMAGQQRPRGRSRSRSSAVPRGCSEASGKADEWCWFHRTFGSQARSCKAPCSFSLTAQGNQ